MTSLALPSTAVLHLGAHKTASTHLQHAIMAAMPGVGRFTVWRFEDYETKFGQICEGMVGTSQVENLPQRMQPRLSENAVDAVLIAKRWTGPEFIQNAATTLPIGPDNPPYDLYDAQTHTKSRAFYAEQWAEISGMPGVTAL